MNPLIPVALYAGAYLLLFVTWALVVFLRVPGADALVQYIHITLGMLSGHLLGAIGQGRANRPNDGGQDAQA